MQCELSKWETSYTITTSKLPAWDILKHTQNDLTGYLKKIDVLICEEKTSHVSWALIRMIYMVEQKHQKQSLPNFTAFKNKENVHKIPIRAPEAANKYFIIFKTTLYL